MRLDTFLAGFLLATETGCSHDIFATGPFNAFKVIDRVRVRRVFNTNTFNIQHGSICLDTHKVLCGSRYVECQSERAVRIFLTCFAQKGRRGDDPIRNFVTTHTDDWSIIELMSKDVVLMNTCTDTCEVHVW